MIKYTIKKLNENTNLNYKETKQTFDEIFSGNASTDQINDFITLLGQKRETPSEIAGTADSLRTHSLSTPKKVVLNRLGLRKDYSNSLNF
ncbi:hypothetical protein [Companilactobacillus zhachilii]|nr:hypothetical protein [Companilactobacillus zhachilii]